MRTTKKFDELTIADNFIFSKVMLNQKLAKHFLEVILGCEIKSISYPKYEHYINVRQDAKSVRLDITLEDDTHTIYNLEMQTAMKPGLRKRSRYYQDLIDLDLLQKGADYDELNQSIVIFICTFDLFGEDQYIYRFRNVCQQIPDLELDDGTEKVFVNTKGHQGDVNDEFKQVVKIFNGLAAEGAFAEELQEEVEKVKSSNEWRREYMTLQILLDETMAEARKEGLAEGRAEGRAEGSLRTLIHQVLKKLQRGKTIPEMTEELEETEEVIKHIVDVVKNYEPDYDVDAICKELMSLIETKVERLYDNK